MQQPMSLKYEPASEPLHRWMVVAYFESGGAYIRASAPTWAMQVNPSTLKPHTSTLNPHPSTLNPQPSTLNPQPSTLTPQPSTLKVAGGALRGEEGRVAETHLWSDAGGAKAGDASRVHVARFRRGREMPSFCLHILVYLVIYDSG